MGGLGGGARTSSLSELLLSVFGFYISLLNN